MKHVVTPFKVGVVVLVALGTFIYMFGRVREGIGDDGSGYRVYAEFRDATGLANKSRVVIAGIGVGQIDKIELVGDKARVWILVNTPLRSDATIAKRQASLLGEYYLQLTAGVKGTPLREGGQITTVIYDTAPADLLNEMKEISANVKEVTASLKEVVTGEGQQKLTRTLTDVAETMEKINRVVSDNAPKIDKIFDNVARFTDDARRFSGQFREDSLVLMTDAKAVTAEVRNIVGRSSGDVQEGFEGVKGAVKRLQNALDKLDGTLDYTRSIAAKIDDGQGTIGRLVNDDRLVTGVTELVDESNRFVRKITRLQTIVAMRSEYYLGQTAVKNYMSLRLQPKPDKYYLFQLVDDPRGKVTFREKVTSTTESTLDPVVREQDVITEDQFRFSLEYAKRFYFATGRIGIIENTGGVGVDLHLLDDSLELSSDIFAFDENVNPRMKFWAAYTFFTHLYIAAGIDDVWNDELTDFFVGAEIRFNDDDLKAIFTAAPTPSL